MSYDIHKSSSVCLWVNVSNPIVKIINIFIVKLSNVFAIAHDINFDDMLSIKFM